MACFDEALNHVIQRGQMDVHIRFWDETQRKVATRQFASAFLGHARATDLLEKCTFIFSMSCSIASVTSYLSENEAKNLQNGDVHIAQIPDLKWNILRTIWRIEVGDGLLFCIFHALSFELNFFFDRRFPLRELCFNEELFI